MKKFGDSKRIFWRTLQAVLPLFMLLFMIPLLSWREAIRQDEVRVSLTNGVIVANTALEMKFRAANMNGWQNAYALEVLQRGAQATNDRAATRVAFLRSTADFLEVLNKLEKSALDEKLVFTFRSIEVEFARFMELEEQIIETYRVGSRDSVEDATHLVLHDATRSFEALARSVDSLAKDAYIETIHRADIARLEGMRVRWYLGLIAIIALFLSIGIVIVVHRWIRRTEGLLVSLEDQAVTDPLTGIANRRALISFMPRIIASAHRQQQTLTVAMLDLDNFKKFNDQYGHLAGDALLIEVARRLQSRMRNSDFLARFGGEEFVVVLVDCSPDDANRILEKMRDNMPDGQTFSVGAAQWSAAEPFEACLRRADEALYKAKRLGRNRIEWTDDSALFEQGCEDKDSRRD